MIPILKLELPREDRAELERRCRSKSATARDSFRARMVLLRAEGLSKLETARKLDTSESPVQKWTGRYQRLGIAGRTRHSTRTMAKAAGVSQSTVFRTWRAVGIKPHLTRTFKVSTDPDFLAKFWDVIGLYLAPPEKAVVFCCDEKTQC